MNAKVYIQVCGFICRTLLAAMDYNENCNRQQKLHQETGEPLWCRRVRKWALDKATLTPVLSDKTYSK